MWKWVLGIAAALFLLVAGYVLYLQLIVNPKVLDEIRANPQGERAGIVMVLTFPDGRQMPVNYLREGNRVFAGADGWWWRTFRGGGVPVTVEIRGESFPGHATVVLDDPDYVADVFSRLRPTVPEWLPDWLNGKLVVVTLE